jgi:NHL repeat
VKAARGRVAWLVVALACLGVVAPALGGSPAAATISTVAGTGTAGHTGDGGPAAQAEIGHPRGIAIAPAGGFVFAEPFNATVRRVLPNGTIITIAGTGVPGFSGDGGPATEAQLDLPHGVAFTPSGSVLVADTLNNRIRLVAPDGTITTVAGDGLGRFSGDGGPASQAEIATPRGISAMPDGGYLIADTDNERIRRVLPDGTIETVAGSGVMGSFGDGGPALEAGLDSPFAAVPVAGGGYLIADTGNHRVRRVLPDGTIETVAGTGAPGFSGDGGPATEAELDAPHAVVSLPDGGFLVADTMNDRVRRVLPDGTIETVAGVGPAGFSGDGGLATEAELDEPKALSVLADRRGFLVGDAVNNRVRLVSLDLRPGVVVRIAAPPTPMRAGRLAVLRYRLTEPARARLEVRRSGRVALVVEQQGMTGRNAIAFRPRLRPGLYALRLRVTTPDDRTAIAFSHLRVVP